MSASVETLTGQNPSTTAGASDSAETKVTSNKNWVPNTKVSVGLLAASLTTLLLPYFSDLLGRQPSGSDGAAVTTILTLVIQYFVPERVNTTQA